MSWHGKVVSQVAGIHGSLQSESIMFDPDSEACPFQAIVRIEQPSRTFERGEGTAHRGTLIVQDGDDPGLVKGSKLVMRSKVYMVERVDRAGEGLLTVYVIGNSQEYTAHSSAVNQGR